VTDLWVRRGGSEADLITCEIEADGFLYNMVRAIVGALHEVGRGARPEGWPGEVLAACDRRAGAMTAPPQGLFLVSVCYP
jgi:tRNA pseudouridine38-40 synthase